MGRILAIHAAGGFRLIDPQRVEIVGPVQKALHRGAGDDVVVGGQQHGLPQLIVPGAETQPVALEAIEHEFRRQQVIAKGRERHALCALHGCRHRLDGQPGGPVGITHRAASTILEPLLQLRCPMPRPGPVPGQSGQTLRPDERARVHHLIVQVAGEFAIAVGDEDHVMVRALGQQQRIVQFPLPRVIAQHEGTFIFDLQPVARGTAPEGIGHCPVRRQRPHQDQHLPPAAQGKELAHRIGPHGVTRRDVQQIGLTVRPTQVVRAGTDIEEHHLPVSHHP